MTERYEPMRQLFEEVDRRVGRSRWVATAVVLEVDKSDRTVRVSILPEWQETGWIKVYFLNAGTNYISGPLPEEGSEVVCLFLGADPNTAFILAGGFIEDSEESLPTLKDDNEFPIFDKYGNKITLNTEGINIYAKGDLKINVTGKATVEATTIELGEGAAEAVVKGDTFKTLYNAHTHPTGAGPSGPPVVPMAATELSTKVKTV